MRKTLLATVLAFSMIATPVEAHQLTTKYVQKNVTIHMLTHRKDNVQLVEVIKGKCTSQKKDGRILNTDSRYNYISYRGVKGCHKGDTVTTLCYYDPNCNYTDCIWRRVDIVKCKHNHKTVKTDRIWLDDMCK